MRVRVPGSLDVADHDKSAGSWCEPKNFYGGHVVWWPQSQAGCKGSGELLRELPTELLELVVILVQQRHVERVVRDEHGAPEKRRSSADIFSSVVSFFRRPDTVDRGMRRPTFPAVTVGSKASRSTVVRRRRVISVLVVTSVAVARRF